MSNGLDQALRGTAASLSRRTLMAPARRLRASATASPAPMLRAPILWMCLQDMPAAAELTRQAMMRPPQPRKGRLAAVLLVRSGLARRLRNHYGAQRCLSPGRARAAPCRLIRHALLTGNWVRWLISDRAQRPQAAARQHSVCLAATRSLAHLARFRCSLLLPDQLTVLFRGARRACELRSSSDSSTIARASGDPPSHCTSPTSAARPAA